MAKKIVFYRDSNTYGFDPRDFFGGRYDRGIIWTDRIAENPDFEVCPCGENGREIPHVIRPISETNLRKQSQKLREYGF